MRQLGERKRGERDREKRGANNAWKKSKRETQNMREIEKNGQRGKGREKKEQVERE